MVENSLAEDILKLTKNIYMYHANGSDTWQVSAIQKWTAEILEKMGMYDLVGLHDYLVSLFEREIDMISVDFISPFIAEKVRSDAILYSGAVA